MTTDRFETHSDDDLLKAILFEERLQRERRVRDIQKEMKRRLRESRRKDKATARLLRRLTWGF